MPFIDDQSLDALLDDVGDNTDAIYICSQEPATYTEATSTYALGSKSSPTIGVAGDRTPNGRKRTVSSISDGTVSGTGTATSWAATDSINSRLKAAESLSSPQGVTSGNTFTLTAFDIGVPDAA